MEIDIYLELMSEVKRRMTAVKEILSKKSSTTYQVTNIEFMCLQIRKILELISLGSLVANRKELELIQAKYHKFYHAERILNDIERLNPEFYPRPIVDTPSELPNVINDLETKKTGFLTTKEFVKIYEKCGKIMHADNPFGSKVDYDYYEKQIISWCNKIVGLLSVHMVKPKGLDVFYLIHMDEKGDERVHGYTFQKVK